MNIVDKLKYNKPITLDMLYLDGKAIKITLEKTLFPQLNKNQYFIKVYGYVNENYQCLAYMYFYLTPDLELDQITSDFIGGFVTPECRGKGLYSLLLAKWSIVCLENDIYKLDTTKNQRKAILIYTLTKFAFELADPTLYEKMKDFLIYICSNGEQKRLWIPNEKFSESYRMGNIAKDGQYDIINNSDMAVIDNDGNIINVSNEIFDMSDITISTPNGVFTPLKAVLTSQRYVLENPNDAYETSKNITKKFIK